MALGGSGGSGGASGSAIKAGEAFFEITGNDQKFREIINQNIARIKRFGQTVRNIGIGVAGAGGAILTPLTLLFKSSLDKAADTQKLAERLNSTSEEVSRVGYAAETSGVQLEDWTKAAEKMNTAAFQAAKGGVDQAIAFEQLGLSAQEFVNLPLEEKFLKIADSVSKSGNPLEKTQILTGLFGDEFGKLIPLFKNGRDGLQGMLSEASQVGAVINSDDAKQAVEINKQLNKVWISLKSVLYEVGIAVLGFRDDIKEGSIWLLDMLKNVRDWIKENRELITIIFSITAAIVGGGVALATFGIAISGIIAGMVALKAIGLAIIGIVFSPLVLKIALISTAIGGLIYLFTEFTDAGQTLKSQFVEAFNGIVDTFKLAFGGILDALKKGDLELAGKIAIIGLQSAWQEGVNFLTSIWVRFKGLFVDVFQDAVAGIRLMWNDLYSWLLDKTILIVGKIVENIGAVTDKLGITDDLEKTSTEALKLAREENQRERRDKADQILQERANRQRENDAFREQQLNEGKSRLQQLKDQLRGLVEEAKPKEKEMEERKKKEEELRRADAVRLGDSVKGVFSSSDFRGSLGLGKANEFAKKAYEVQKAALSQLVQINNKLDPVKFE